MSTQKDQKETTRVLLKVTEKYLPGSLSRFQYIGAGFNGMVYKVWLTASGREKVYVVKLLKGECYKSRSISPVDQFLGMYPLNAEASYQTLSEHKIPVCRLYQQQPPTEGISYGFQALGFLQGVSATDQLVSEGGRGSSLQALVGRWLAEMNKITRPYFGPVERNKPYDSEWKKTFFGAIKNLAQTVIFSDAELNKLKGRINSFLMSKERSWIKPQEFVLSDKAIFQAIVRRVGGAWHLVGIIDLEDIIYTDQRFVLSGFETFLSCAKSKVSPSFWEAYQSVRPIEPSYGDFRELFMLFYALHFVSGIYNCFDERSRAEQQEMLHSLQRYKQIISDVLD